MIVEIGTREQLEVYAKLSKVLNRECKNNPVLCQQVIELMVVNYCLRMGVDWEKVADGIHKHVKQIIETLA